MPRTCAFCRRERKLTLEHAFPSWIQRYLPHSQHVTSVTHTAKAEGEELRAWKTRDLDVKVKRVCAECNNGWMSDLEQVARLVLVPLMNGRPRRLVASEQEIIAVWAIKTALVCEFIHPSARGASDLHFRDIGERLNPPRDSHVWLARYEGPKELDYNHRVLVFTDSSDTKRTGYITSFIINRLVIYVMDVQEGPPLRTELSAHAERGAVPIHPVKYGVVSWPPQVALADDAAVESFLLAIAPDREDPPLPSGEF
jgi:hypothetical protein